MRDISPNDGQNGGPVNPRVEDLLSRMTLEEKVGQLNVPMPLPKPALAMLEPNSGHPSSYDDLEAAVDGQLTDGVGPVGGFFLVETYGFEGGPAEQAQLKRQLQKRAASTRLGIPLLFVTEGTHAVQATGATIFPEGPGLGSTWNLDLIRDVYHAIAAEARATGNHALCTLVVEPIRDPRLGRNIQAYTEDPHLNAALARAIVDGVQGDSLAAPDRAAAILTHFPGQSEPVAGMERGAVELSERVLREVYLPAWFAAAGPHGAAGVMATYATVDGMPIHGHRKWLRRVLRNEIGFTGVTFSEGFGFETLLYEGIVETQREAGALAMTAGVDASITWEQAYRRDLLDAVHAGVVADEQVDDAVRRVLALKDALGLFDDANAGIDPAAARTPAHVDLALRAARESLVLLKNEAQLLPLGAGMRIAVIGPNADNGRNLLGDYVASSITQPIPSVVDVLRERLGDDCVSHVRGCDETDRDDVDIDGAVRAARNADVAVVVLGERSGEMFFDTPTPTNGERHDVASLDLSGAQQQLLEAVHATGVPVVLVLVNGRPLSVPWAATHIPAIIEAWLPGERGADAIVDVLLGIVNPSGRLSVTIPRSAGHLPAYYNAKRSKHYWSAQGGYVDDETAPLYPFGHGLSYSTVTYGDLAIARSDTAVSPVATVSFTITNDDLERSTLETPQLYVRDRTSSVATPDRQLRHFAKVALAPGATQRVTFALTVNDLALLTLDGSWQAEAGVFDILVGTSSTDIRLRADLTLTDSIVAHPSTNGSATE